MAFLINIEPSGHAFTVEENESLLDAGLRHGIEFAYGCCAGVCGTCRARVLSGELKLDTQAEQTLSLNGTL